MGLNTPLARRKSPRSTAWAAWLETSSGKANKNPKDSLRVVCFGAGCSAALHSSLLLRAHARGVTVELMGVDILQCLLVSAIVAMN
jgi:diphthamide biosynthesis methyltransferase